MPTQSFPDEFSEFAFMPQFDQRIAELSQLAEPEDWNYKNSQSARSNPVLSNYIKYTYKRLSEEQKISLSSDASYSTFNTGLVTTSQEPIYALFSINKLTNRDEDWHFSSWCRKGQPELSRFPFLPDMAHYFDDPASLVFDTRKEFRPNIEHIVVDNLSRFPAPFNSMDNYMLQTFLKGAIDNARERVRRNYKTAIPQYYKGRIQLLLPLCIRKPDSADLALVVEDHESFYRASTCLTLDMAYNNARQLARPDRDWLQP